VPGSGDATKTWVAGATLLDDNGIHLIDEGG
jgi:hypothetical protein